MAYTPSYSNQILPEYTSFNFALWQHVKEILAYYNGLTPGDANYYREMTNGDVYFGYTDKNLKKLNNQTGVEWMLTIQQNWNDKANSLDGSKVGKNLDNAFILPYQFTIRTLHTTTITTASVGDPKFRLAKIFDRLTLDLCDNEDGQSFSVAPNTIDYLGTVQSSLISDTVTIQSDGTNRCLNDRVITDETINSRQFVTGSESYQVGFRVT